jgi:hypothetical protein
MGIFREFTAYDLIEVDDSHRSLDPVERFQGFKATSASNKASILIHDRQMQEACKRPTSSILFAKVWTSPKSLR